MKGQRSSDRVRTLAGAVAVLGVATTLGCAPRTNDSSVARVGASDVTQLLAKDRSGALLIDARPEESFRTATIPGAVLLRLSDIPEGRLEPRLSRYSSFIVFGQNPGSAAPVAIAKRMIAAGYANVSMFEAGVDAWVASGGRTQPGTRVGLP